MEKHNELIQGYKEGIRLGVFLKSFLRELQDHRNDRRMQRHSDAGYFFSSDYFNSSCNNNPSVPLISSSIVLMCVGEASYHDFYCWTT